MDDNITFVSKLIGVSSSTIRRWERDGLIPFKIRRNNTGYRVFNDDEIRVLKKIRDMFENKRLAPTLPKFVSPR